MSKNVLFTLSLKVLMDVFEQDVLVIYHHPVEELSVSQTYGEVVKDLIMDEKQYLRDLQVIRKQKFCGPDPMLNFCLRPSAKDQGIT